MGELANDDTRIVLPDGSEYNLADLSEDELLELYQRYEGELDETAFIGTLLGGDFVSTLQSCVGPTTWQTMEMAGKLFSVCLIVRLVTLLNLSDNVKHLVSCLCGLAALVIFFGEHDILPNVFLLCSVGYVLVYATPKYKGGIVSFSCVVYLLTCEMFIVASTTWNTIKGSMMLLCMKMISLAFDVEHGSITSVPNIVEYSGYVLCPSSIIFGPFMMYNDYCQILRIRRVSVSWLISLTRTIVFGYVFLIMSSCVGPWIFPGDSNKWFLAYQTALSFRCSNYFVGYLAEASSLLCGIGTLVKKDDDETVECLVFIYRNSSTMFYDPLLVINKVEIFFRHTKHLMHQRPPAIDIADQLRYMKTRPKAC